MTNSNENPVLPIIFLVGVALVFAGVFAFQPDRPAPQQAQAPTAVAEAATPDAQPTQAMDELALRSMGLEQVNASDVSHGEQLFRTTCTACHGFDARGISGLGKTLIDSEFVNTATNAELVAFLQIGRTPSDPLNTTGMAMPARGGNSGLTDDDLYTITSYIRSLNGATIVDDSAVAGAPTQAVIEQREFAPLDVNALDPSIVPPSDPAGGNLNLLFTNGEEAYLWSCAGCHAVDGTGVAHVPGTDLTQTTLGLDQIVGLLTVASEPTDPNAGFVHPLAGGYPPLSDDLMRQVAEYVQSLGGE